MKRLGIVNLFFLPSLFLLCLSDTALGQPTLTFTDPNQTNNPPINAAPAIGINYAVAATGQSTQSQMLVTASTATSVSYRVNTDQQTGLPYAWFTINNNSAGTIPSVANTTTLGLKVNTQNLAQGNYSGSFQVGLATNFPNNATTFNISLSVGTGSGNGVLSSSILNNHIDFSAVQGNPNGSPSSVPVQINSSSTAISYQITAGYTGQTLSWLLLNTTTGVTGGAGFSVSVNPTGLSAGTSATSYNANILVTDINNSNNRLNISVTLTVSITGTLTVSPANPPAFLYQVGGAQPTPQTITVSSPSQISFTINTNACWLVSNAFGGTAGPNTPFPFTLSVQTACLQLGTTSTILTLIPNNGASQVNITVSVVVSNSALIQASPNSLSFTAAFAGASPPDQSVAISTTGSGNGVGFTITPDPNATWLTYTLSQSVTPATLTVHINQGALAVNNYVGTLTLRPTNGDNYSVAVTVNLSVGTSQQFTAGPPVLLFSYQTNRSLPAPQTVNVASTGQQVGFTVGVQTTACSGNWLFAQASQNFTPATISVQIAAPGPSSGTCTGTITITPTSGNTTQLQIPVTVTIANAPLFTLSMPPGFGYEIIQQAQSAGVVRTIAANSTDGSALQFNTSATTSNGGNWLFVSGSGSTPQNIGVIFQPGNLGAGVYTGNIVLTSATLPNGTYNVPITMTITPNVTITIAPSQLSFTAAQNGPLPASQTLTFTNSGGSPSFTANVSQNCQGLIGVNPSSGAASGNLTVSVLSTAGSVNTFNCQINFIYSNAAGSTATVPVTLTINNPQTITASTNALTFAYQLTQPAPAAQKITLASTGGAVQFSVGVTSSGGWLTADTTNGTTPKDVMVSVNPANLTVAGSPYTGQVSISAPGVLTNPIVVTVTVNVSAAPTPQVVTVTSTATNLAGTIAVGELITIKGTLLGPTSAGGVLFSLNAQGGVNSTLSGVRVLFDGIPGTPIFVSASQINVIVPYEIAGRLSTNIVVEYQGIQSAQLALRVSDSAPGLFTLNQTGSGQVAAVNQNGTFNGPQGGGTTPATVGATGTTVVLYGTGGGQTNPPGVTGSVTPVPQTASQLQKIPGIVSATVGGVAARVDYAGQAPGLVTGVMQFNLFLFPGTPTGNQTVVITINGISSGAGATIAVN